MGLPYVIFSPPGTGKTMITYETILQILIIIPEKKTVEQLGKLNSGMLVESNILKDDMVCFPFLLIS